MKKKTIQKTENGKNWNKNKTVEQGKPMNSHVMHEISPDGTSGL